MDVGVPYCAASGKGNRDVILNNVDNGQPKTLSIPFEILICYGNRELASR